MSSSPDSLILKGISKIINRENVRQGIDPEEIEKSMVDGDDSWSESSKEIEEEIEKKHKSALDEYAEKLGIDLNCKSNAYKKDDDSDTENSESEDDKDLMKLLNRDNTQEKTFSHYGSDHESKTEQLSAESRTQYPSFSSSSYLSNNTNSSDQRLNFLFKNDNDRIFDKQTVEQRKHSQIQDVMKEMGSENTNVWSVEKEKIEDEKAAMLEEIDSLKMTLEEEGIDVSRIPPVDQNSDYNTIEAVHKMLRLKNDRARYCSFAEEFVLFGAHGLEELFNGKNVWLGRYTPDLTGWHNQVQVKLRRMRHDTSTLVSGIMSEYNIGPGMRILLELIPSLFMYSKMRKQQFGSKKLYSEESLGDTMNRIRNIDENE